MKSDPFAPITSPAHVKNLKGDDPAGGRHAELERRHALAIDMLLEYDPNAKPIRDQLPELLDTHVTDHELLAQVFPNVEELQRRATLVTEYRDQLAEEGPDAEAPTLVDLETESYRWSEGDRTEEHPDEPSGQPDGETASGWVHVPEPQEDSEPEVVAVPPRNGPGSDTETWRAYAAKVTDTEQAQWATMNRTEIIATLEGDGVIPSEQA